MTNERPTVQQTVAVRDITGEEDRYSLDTHGFQLLHHESRTKQFDDVEVLKSDYFPEMVELVKNMYGRPSPYYLHVLLEGSDHDTLFQALAHASSTSSTTQSAVDQATGTA